MTGSDVKPSLIAQRVIPVLRFSSAELTERATDPLPRPRAVRAPLASARLTAVKEYRPGRRR